MIGKPDFLPVPLGFSWLTGPIFDKELRVSSRRQRNYLLRLAYVSLLGIVVAAVWLAQVTFVNLTGLNWASQMAEAGKRIVIVIVWFQFYATQLLAVIMLSTSINDEVYRGTLNTLMTTPITSVQIVTGKLLSKLIQIILLLAISLPLLTFVRIFGGVPWDYVVSSLCITLTAVIFVGSVSLLFSTFCRRAYVVIVVTVLTLGVLFWMLSGMLIELFGHPWGGRSPLCKVALYPNPYMLLGLNSDILFNPRMVGTRSVSVLAHCGIMLAASAGVLCVCVRQVRKLALTRAVTGGRISGRSWRPPPARSVGSSIGAQSSRPIRRVAGPPVMWKELISRSAGREKIFVRTIIVTELVMIVAIYLFPYVAVEAGMDEAHAAYVAIFMGLGALAVTVVPASCITSEKETRAWPLLLTTMVSDWEILFGKFVGVLRRCLPIWAVLLVYVWGMAPEGVIQAAGLVIATTVFLCGTGFYVSSHLRRTTSAVAANFIIAALIWGILPALVTLTTFTFRPVYGRSLIERCWQTTPFVRVVEATWPASPQDLPGSALYVTGYILVGVLFAWRAKCRFRRDVF